VTPGPRFPRPLDALALDHVAIAVPGLDDATGAYLALGMRREGEDEAIEEQGVRVRPLRLGDTLVELMEPLRSDCSVARFLERRGPGLHHIALRVPQLEPLLDRLRDTGARLIDDRPRPGRAGTRIAFVHPDFTQGVLVELVEP